MTHCDSSFRLVLIGLLFTASGILSVALADDRVKCGIDVLVSGGFEELHGKRIVLVTHQAARTMDGRATAEVFIQQKTIRLLRILTPEHGYYGAIAAGKPVQDESLDGVQMFSLYGPSRRPKANHLQDADVVVVDLQDIGVRSYTYLSTMIEVIVACAEWDIPVIILDRPNPLGGVSIDGLVVEERFRSFIGRIPIPYVHGCTLGELALMANGEGWIKDDKGLQLTATVRVVKMNGWRRKMSFWGTGKSWFPTSPNIPSVESVLGYATVGMVGELGLANIGVGTQLPFQVIGFPGWKRDTALESRLAYYGYQVLPTSYSPSAGKFAGSMCSGYLIRSLDFNRIKPFKACLALIYSLHAVEGRSLPPEKSNATLMFNKAAGTDQILNFLSEGVSWDRISSLADVGIGDYVQMRENYLLYE